jgi:hypothetical protein
MLLTDEVSDEEDWENFLLLIKQKTLRQVNRLATENYLSDKEE